MGDLGQYILVLKTYNHVYTTTIVHNSSKSLLNYNLNRLILDFYVTSRGPLNWLVCCARRCTMIIKGVETIMSELHKRS